MTKLTTATNHLMPMVNPEALIRKAAVKRHRLKRRSLVQMV